MRRPVLPLTAATVFCAVLLSSMPAPAVAQSVPTDVEQAALAGDWNRVWTILGAEKTNPEPAELRLIKGHACLALNYNNQSLELFASALNDVDRTAWQQWADAFAAAHPASAIAWYFKGDALARQKQWKSSEKDTEKAKKSPGADECFAEAIRLDPRCYLVLNARGVVAHAVGNTIMARQYLIGAMNTKRDFADAYLSQGVLKLYFYSGAAARKNDDGPATFFGRARDVSRDENPLSVLVGLGCMHYISQDYMEARRHFDAVPEGSALASVAQRNALATEARKLGKAVQDALAVGMSIESVGQALVQEGDLGRQLQERLNSGYMALSTPPDWQIWILTGVLEGVIIFGDPGKKPPDDLPVPPPVEQPVGPKQPPAGAPPNPPTPDPPTPNPPTPNNGSRYGNWVISADNIAVLTDALNRSTSEQPTVKHVGGVNSASPVDRRWGVSSAYGLLYALPPDRPPRIQMRKVQ